jgi:hypothetical protein
MTNKIKLYELCAAVFAVIIIASAFAVRFATDASATLKQKPKRTVAYRRLHPKGIKAPVVIQDLTVDGREQGLDEPAEFHKFSEVGVARLDLDYKISRRTDQYGNQYKYRAKVRDVHGAQVGRWAWDVILVKE